MIGGDGEKPFMNREEVMDVLDVSANTLHKLVLEGSFPEPLKLGKRLLRWRRTDVEAFINTGWPAKKSTASNSKKGES